MGNRSVSGHIFKVKKALKTVDTVNRGHHRKSISKLNYFAACPGFESKPFDKNAAADEGTMLHSYMELAINWAIKRRGAGFADASVSDGVSYAIVNLSPKQRIVEWKDEHKELLEFCALYADKYFLNPSFSSLKQELKVTLLPHVDTNGSFDILIFFGETVALLLDWKFGRVAVPAAAENYQGKGYAAGCLLKWPKLQRVGVVFVQPRLYSATEAIFERKNSLENILSEIKGVLDATESKNKILRLNAYCSYCMHQTECPAVAAHFAAAVTSFHRLPAPPSFDGAALDKPSDIALLRYWVDLLESITDTIKGRALEAAIANGGSIETQVGDEIIRYEVHERSSARTLGLPNLVAEALKDHLLPEEVLGAAKLSIGKLEAIWAEEMSKRGLATSKKEAKEGLSALLESEGLLTQSDFQIKFLKTTREKIVKAIN